MLFMAVGTVPVAGWMKTVWRVRESGSVAAGCSWGVGVGAAEWTTVRRRRTKPWVGILLDIKGEDIIALHKVPLEDGKTRGSWYLFVVSAAKAQYVYGV